MIATTWPVVIYSTTGKRSRWRGQEKLVGCARGACGEEKHRNMKDRLGEQRGGGSDWEPIKILLEGD
jgi:hypothetical protein